MNDLGFANMSPLSKLVFFKVYQFLEISSSSYCSFGVKQQSLTSLLIYHDPLGLVMVMSALIHVRFA
jgi:hypothetical protein